MSTRLTYVMVFVADMDRAFAFYRDVVGLKPRFQSPGWSEFDTGGTTLALHQASEEVPAGTVRIGIGVPDVESFHRDKSAAGITFTSPPTPLHGSVIARFLDSEGAEVTVGA